MALHLAFDLPQDKLIWDVGHQAYTHKLLTGRRAGFDDLRKYGGMSGFPKRKVSAMHLIPGTAQLLFPPGWVMLRPEIFSVKSTMSSLLSGTVQ